MRMKMTEKRKEMAHNMRIAAFLVSFSHFFFLLPKAKNQTVSVWSWVAIHDYVSKLRRV